MDRSSSLDATLVSGQTSFFSPTGATPSPVLQSSPKSSTSSFSASPPIPGLAELNLNSDDTASTSSSPSKGASTTDPSDPNFKFGEAVFNQRRAAWLALPAPENANAKRKSPGRLGLLEEVLDELPEGDIPDDVWKGGLEGVWRGLIGGRRLASPMPLPTVIKVLKAGWIKDGTWPTNYIVGPSSSPPLTPPLPATERPIVPHDFALVSSTLSASLDHSLDPDSDQQTSSHPVRPSISPHSLDDQAQDEISTSMSSASASSASTILLSSTPK